ncbi:AAA family ATPase [Nocardioides sp. SOB77]|uniref:AAA family ATPase n=1 Tax=Nocardioides oceani TaxID=3058369 RepID=A0ABT8FLK8_9ACTN|nr:AAA family ATPase [Nocardioides oceani]MDN4175553.1 AAA family ATPase [Nocardioides oceani]
MARLLHLNGPPGIGKSTIARRYADAHPGVLNCDIDVLRTMVGGWTADFAQAGALIRPAALAMIGAYLAQGRDVVLPQMLVDPAELARFERCAVDAGAHLVERWLMDTPDGAVRRFHGRGCGSDPDPWHERVRTIVTAQGGDDLLLRYHDSLRRLLADRPGAVVVPSVDGAVDETYRALVDSLP